MKFHYKLEFDIKSDYEDIGKAVENITTLIMAGLENTKKVIEIEAKAKVIKVEVE